MNEYYQVIQTTMLYELEAAVRKLIQEQWKPAGGIFIISRKLNKDGEFDDKGVEQPIFYQAMTRGI